MHNDDAVYTMLSHFNCISRALQQQMADKMHLIGKLFYKSPMNLSFFLHKLQSILKCHKN